MNGKIAKRIRYVACIISRSPARRGLYRRLKREYLALPYHRRVIPFGRPGFYVNAQGCRKNPPHSAMLRARK